MFHHPEDLTQDDYDGIVHYLEDELDYQYSLLCTRLGHLGERVVNEHEKDIEDEVAYYESLNEDMERCDDDWLSCPQCCEGLLREVQPNYVVCSKCGLHVQRSLQLLQSQLSSIFQSHRCPKPLKCSFVPNAGLLFTCSSCGFCSTLQ